MNPINWVKQKRDTQLRKMKLAGANKKEDVQFFLHVLEHDYRVYNNFIFMPGVDSYYTKLTSIGFKRVSNDETYLESTDELVHFYNDKLNLSVHMVSVANWKALTTAVDVVKALKTIESEFTAISTIFTALRTYKA